MAEKVFTWVSEIPPHRAAEVQRFILRLDNDFSAGSALPLATLPMLHFASLTFCRQREGEGPLLLFECCIDAPFSAFVHLVVERCRAALDFIYQGCKHYPDAAILASADGNEKVVRYFSSRKVRRRAHLFHLGHPNRSVQCVRADYELRRSLAQELEVNEALRNLPPRKLIAALRRTANCPRWLGPLTSLRADHHSWSDPPDREAQPTRLSDIRWVRQQRSWVRLVRGYGLLGIAAMLGIAVVLLLQRYIFREAIVAVEFLVFFAIVHYTSSGARVVRGLSIALGLSVAIYFLLRLPLFSDPEWLSERLVYLAIVLTPSLFLLIAYLRIEFVLKPTAPMPVVNGRPFLEAEDQPEHSIYNHVVGLSELCTDYRWIRLLRTWMVLRLLNLFYRTEFVKGQLVTVPSNHFAHWTLINRRYLLFVTNYEGSADRYLDDFFESLARGIAFIWFDTIKYPRTTDPRVLKGWVRHAQTLALTRYRAATYDDLTVAQINSARLIRKRLLRAPLFRKQQSAERWMHRFTTTLTEDPKFYDVVDRWLRKLSPMN